MSKLPVYMLYVFNFISYELNKINHFRYAVLPIMTLLIQTVGFISYILFAYGVLSNTMSSRTPGILTYAYISIPFYLHINSCLFLYKSWKRENTNRVLHLLDETLTPYMWAVKARIWMVCMVACVLGSLLTMYFLIAYMYQSEIY